MKLVGHDRGRLSRGQSIALPNTAGRPAGQSRSAPLIARCQFKSVRLFRGVAADFQGALQIGPPKWGRHSWGTRANESSGLICGSGRRRPPRAGRAGPSLDDERLIVWARIATKSGEKHSGRRSPTCAPVASPIRLSPWRMASASWQTPAVLKVAARNRLSRATSIRRGGIAIWGECWRAALVSSRAVGV